MAAVLVGMPLYELLLLMSMRVWEPHEQIVYGTGGFFDAPVILNSGNLFSCFLACSCLFGIRTVKFNDYRKPKRTQWDIWVEVQQINRYVPLKL